MKKQKNKWMNYILTISLLGAAVSSPVSVFRVQASSISQVQQQINETQNQLNGINSTISSLSGEQDLVEEKIEDLNAEIINTMTSIGMKEDEIAQKEIALSEKQTQIEQTQAEYEAAKAREEAQQADMQVRARLTYENSTKTPLGFFLEGTGLSDMLNRMDYVEKIYEYDKLKLQEYVSTKNQVHDLWEQLEEEKAQLEVEKTQLEADREALKSEKSNLDTMLAKRKEESANYDAEIKKAQQQAAVAKRLLQQEQADLKKLQAAQLAAQQAQNKGNSSSAASGSYTTTSYTSATDNATGSELGKKIAKYACQYIGNPYVAGGTSLTNGADCSGFTYRVYQDFGYSLPRTSYEQRNAGTGVSYENAQPGDLICYDGHVALYIGGGMIVHASTAKTGIKVSYATYRTILAVRRII